MTGATPAPGTTEPAALDVRGLRVRLGGADIVRDLRMLVPPGEVVGLLGPNGSGKSTLLRTVYRALAPSGGTLLLDGTALERMPVAESAKHVAALAQESSSDLDFTVAEIVAMGRTPHNRSGRLTRAELDLCDEAMARVGVTHLRDRGVLGLSGGERQRVLVARALAQQPRLLVLDEPTNHLDLAHQISLLALLRELDCTVLVVLHDLNLAAAVCDRIHLLAEGRVVRSGTPTEVLTSASIEEVFGARTTVIAHPVTGDPQVLFSLHEQEPS